MLTKIKLALALSGSLLAGAAGIAAAQGAPGAPGAGSADFAARRAAHKQEMLAKYDTNKDGKLDEQERKVMREAKATEVFEKMDLDHNGSISLSEFKQARGKFMRHHRGPGKGFGRRMNGGADKP